MKYFIHADVVTEDENDRVNIEINGDINVTITLLIDIICAIAGEYEVPAKQIVKAIDNELEDWE